MLHVFLQILESAYALAVQTIVPAISNLSYVNSLIVEQAMNLRDTSHKKTNEILDTYYGNVTVKGIDNTAIFIDKLIDKYFPSIDEKEKAISKIHVLNFLFIITDVRNIGAILEKV